MRFNFFDRCSTLITVSLNQLTLHQCVTVKFMETVRRLVYLINALEHLRAVIGQSEPCANLIWPPPALRRLLVVVLL